MSDHERIKSALRYISSDDRETWVRMGMAIKSELGDPGFAIWDAWAQQSASHDDKDSLATWRGIKAGGGITIGTLFHEAKVNGWSDDEMYQKPTDAEIAARKRKSMEQASETEAEAVRKHAQAAEKAAAILEAATEVEAANPYLKRKQVQPVPALKEIHADAVKGILGYEPQSRGEPLEGSLLVVGIEVEGCISSLELIDGTGRKVALASGRKKDGFWATEPLLKGVGKLLVGEGIATVLSGTQATGCVGIAAFSSNNLVSVAKQIRKSHPAASLVVLADLVKKTGEPDPHAIAAARVAGGKLAVPDFGENRPEGMTDFNDLHVGSGLDAVRLCIDEATGQEKESGGIPNGFVCSAKGVGRHRDDGDPELITFKPVKVIALSRNEQGQNWGALVWWEDLDGKAHEMAIAKKLFHAQGTELAQILADGGLPIVPGKERNLLRYLAAFDVQEKLTAASCTGWLEGAFVLPDECVNEPAGRRIIYQPSGISNTSKAIRRAGTLDGWQRGMRDASPMVKFGVCVSLSAPIRFLLGIEAGGFHVYNLTSQGKTTMLQTAAAVWGNGTDPAIAGGSEVYIQRWNATANALEARAEAFNDLPMIVDEIGEGDPAEFGRTIYRILSGTGRGRANTSGGLRDSKSWRITILSAGEIAVSDFIESGGGKLKGGQMVRMVDIDLSAATPLFANAEQANAMKQQCAQHFGHAGPEFLQHIDNIVSSWKSFDAEIIGPATTAIAKRVRGRFALVAHVGVVASRARILPWPESEVREAVWEAYGAWHERSNSVSDVERGVNAVRDFILAYESRFETGEETWTVRDRAGWLRADLFHFTPAAFKEACGGVDATKVKKALDESGLLHKVSGKGLSATIKVMSKSVTVTSVKAAILSDLSESSGASGASGASPGNIRDSGETISGAGMVPGGAGDKGHSHRDTSGTNPNGGVVPDKRSIHQGRTQATPPAPPKNDDGDATSDAMVI